MNIPKKRRKHRLPSPHKRFKAPVVEVMTSKGVIKTYRGFEKAVRKLMRLLRRGDKALMLFDGIAMS